MKIRQQYKSYHFYQSQPNTTQIITNDNSFLRNGKLKEEIQQFQQLKSLKINKTYLNDINSLIPMKLTKLDIAYNRFTSINSLETMTTLQILNISGNPITQIPILPLQLKSLHCIECPLFDNKQTIRSLYRLSQLTCLDIPRSTIEDPVDPTLQLQSLQRQRKITKLIKNQKEYYEKIHNTPAPLLFDSDVYLRILVLFLPNLLLMNKERITQEVRQVLKQSVNEELDLSKLTSRTSILENELTSNEILTIHKLGTVQRNYSSFVSSLYGFSKTPCKHLVPQLRTVRQVEFNKFIPGEIIIGGTDGSVHLLDIQQNKSQQIESPFNVDAFGICWDNQINRKSHCLIGNNEGILCLYDFEKQYTPITTINGLNRISSVHINSIGDTFTTTGYLSNVNLFDYETMKIKHVFSQMHRNIVNVAKYANQDPHLLTTCSYDGSVCMWDTRTDCTQPIHRYVGETQFITTIFSSNDKNILIAGFDNYVGVLDLRNMRFIRMQLERRWNPNSSCRAYYCNGDESIVVSNSNERTLHVLRAYDGKRILDCHSDDVNPLFSGIVSVRSDPFNDFNFLSVMCDQSFTHFGLFQCELF